MIGIKIGDNFADTYSDTRVSLILNNPILNEDNLSPGSLSLPFDLPVGDESSVNDELLGTPDVLENSDGFKRIEDVILFCDDLPLKKGTLVVDQVNGNNASTNFIFGLSTLSPEIKVKKLRDILDQTVIIHNVNVGKKIYIKPGPGGASPYSINVNGKSYSGTTLLELANAISANTEGTRATATYISSGATFLGMTAPYVMIEPQAPNDALSPLHVSYDNNFFTNFVWLAHAHDPSIYNTAFATFYDTHKNDPRFRFLSCTNNNPYGEDIKPEFYALNYIQAGLGSWAGGTKVTNYVNSISGGNFLMNDPNYGWTINQPFKVKNQNSIQPMIRLRHVLNSIAAYFGFEYEGDFMELPEIDTMMLWNTALLDIPIDFLGSQKFVFFRNSFNIKELVPDITVRDFFLALQSRYNLGVRMNESSGKLRIVMRENIAKNYLYKDITSQCGNKIIPTNMRVTGYKMIAKKDATDTLSVDDVKVIDIAEKEITINTKSFLSYQNVTVSQKMGEPCDLVIFYERTDIFGLKSAAANGSNWIETLDVGNGIYETFWRYWLYAQQRLRSVKLEVDFTINDLRELDWELKHRFDRKDFLIKAINVDVDKNDVKASQVELYTMF